MTNQNNNSQKQNNGSDTAYLIGVIALVGCAIWYNKEAQIKFWLYENLMTIVAYAFLAVAGLVAYVVCRIKRKHHEELARSRAMQSVRPSRNPRNYYERYR